MVEDEKSSTFKPRKLMVKVLKATIKGVLLFVVYYVCWLFLAPFATIIPGLQKAIQIFVGVYISLIVVGEITAGTIYQHFFGVANDLFVISYLILSLNGGMFSMTYQNVALQVDLHLFLMIAMMLSFVGLSKTILQAISFVGKKAETV